MADEQTTEDRKLRRFMLVMELIIYPLALAEIVGFSYLIVDALSKLL